MRTAPTALLLATCLSACSVPGTCDEAAATAVVSTQEGFPAYEGQALMIRSCGGGTFCHSEGIDADSRFGAPAGLDLDLRIASRGTEPGDVDRLERAQTRAFDLRGEIWRQVHSGAMPPGDEGRQVRDSGPVFERTVPGSTTGTPLPEIESVPGMEILRNWLACGTPVIERTQSRADGQPNVVGFTVSRTCTDQTECVFATSSRCDLASNVCAPCEVDAECSHVVGRTACDQTRGECVTPAEPRWASIYEVVIAPGCTSAACHGERQGGNLDMRDPSTAYAELINTPADGAAACRVTGLSRVEPGAPDRSLLVHKLEGEDAEGFHVCAEAMPLGRDGIPAQHLAAIRAWIEAGATSE